MILKILKFQKIKLKIYNNKTALSKVNKMEII